MLDERFGEKQLCWECAQNFHHFRNSSTKFSEFWREIFWQGRHNWILRIRMKIFCFFEGRNWRKIYFFRRKMLCRPFGTLWEKDSPYFWRHYYGRLVKTSLYMFRRRFLQIIFLECLLIFPHFRKSSKNFSEFWRQNFGSVVTTALYMYIGTFLGKLFSFRKVQCFFSGLRNLSCQSVDCRRKLFAIVVKIACSVAKESILMKTNSDQKKVTAFFWTMGNFFAFLATTLQQSCQNFFVHVQTKILRKNRFFGKFVLFFIIFGVRAKSFQSFDEKFLAGFPQLHSTCTLEHLEDISYPFAKFPIFLVVFGIWAANLWIFREKILLALSNLHSLLLKSHFWWKKNFVRKILTSTVLECEKVFRILGNKFTAGFPKFLGTC